MTFRIDRALEGTTVVLRLSGRLRADELDGLERELAASGSNPVLDLDQVTLLDVQTVRLLDSLERQGLELRNCAPYIRAWIARERVEPGAGGLPD